MDNLTHILTGVILSRAGLNRVAPRATLTLALAANAPDVDVISRAWGSLAYLRYHRGPTHALVALPVMAAVVTVVVWLLSREQRFALSISTRKRGSRFLERQRGREGFQWARTYLVALAGVASHTLMDFTNVYGVRPWLPFSGTWYSWDIEFIVDVWLWAVLLACLAGPALGRLISGEIGAPSGSGAGAAILALVFIAGWWGVRDLYHRRAVAMLDAHVYGFDPARSNDRQPAPRPRESVAPSQVAAFPNATNPWVWRGLVETETFYQILNFDVRRPFDPTAGRILYKPERTPALEAAERAGAAREFASFARYRYATVDRREDGYRVVFVDLRFPFRCTVDLDRELRVVAERFSFS